MFRKLLIANRGEIACRIMRSAQRMGIATVGVHSDVDADAPHVEMADEAILIGAGPATESYLVDEHILAAAKETGAEAIHPGYGFLSENADFAEAVRAAGLIFVGPPARAIRDMGGKDNAKALMENAGVPVVPGYYGRDQSPETLRAAADQIGYPVLLKAAMGGGGKGMRAVHESPAFDAALASAIREAEAAFGDGRMLVEKLIEKPRHVEVQIFADSHGNCVHLFERDCSLQRRHQKVIEEAPAPDMNEALRARMGDAALACARAVNYENAGTIEFLLDRQGHFYFMEMNTRLQVEHPVTELITGQDLVEWQLHVAAGGQLPLSQEDLAIDGHAMEARLYAEDPAKGFLPAPGPLDHLVFPDDTVFVRIDTGVSQGQTVSAFYDPMIAKVITWGPDRDTARRYLIDALRNTEVAGTAVNRRFLIRLAGLPAFVEGRADTGLIERMDKPTLTGDAALTKTCLSIAGLHVLHVRMQIADAIAKKSNDPGSPWHSMNGWRLGDLAHQDIHLRFGETEICLRATRMDNAVAFSIEDDSWVAQAPIFSSDGYKAVVAGHHVSGRVGVSGNDKLRIFHDGEEWDLVLFDPASGDNADDGGAPAFIAPMPGKVVAVNVTRGSEVLAGDVLVILEAMKMEHPIKAPVDGTVTAVHYAVGAQVNEGVDLIAFEPAGDA